MKPSREWLEKKFEEFNIRMFGGRLPMPLILLSDASSYLGQCKSKIRKKPDGSTEHYDFQLRFNITYDLPEPVLEDTVIHEMIHYFIMIHGLKDTSPHGRIFKSIMQSINTAHGRNLTITHRVSSEEKAAAKSAKPTWHVIAVIKLVSGVTGVKVLPRNIPRILEFYNKIISIRDVKEARLFLHDNPFFNQFPTSVALKYHRLDPHTIEQELKGASKLLVENGKLIQR